MSIYVVAKRGPRFIWPRLKVIRSTLGFHFSLFSSKLIFKSIPLVARLGIVKLLVENGAEITSTDSDGKTPLDLAKSQGSDSYKPVIEYLEQHERQ